LPVRITDLNYGGHVGNDRILGLLHELRVQFLGSLGFSEIDFAGTSLIMADVSIEFKRELHYGDVIQASIHVCGFTRAGFELLYKFELIKDQKSLLAVSAKTGMVCYDYKTAKISSLPDDFRKLFE
jgi:acyl-CoA thioesterase FadM